VVCQLHGIAADCAEDRLPVAEDHAARALIVMKNRGSEPSVITFSVADD
jgi:hypothetical protein